MNVRLVRNGELPPVVVANETLARAEDALQDLSMALRATGGLR